MPVVTSTVSRPVVLLVQAGRAQGGDVLGRRVPQLRLGRGRGPVGRPLGRPGQDGAPDDDREQEDERGRAGRRATRGGRRRSLTTVAMSQAWATTRSAVAPPTAMARTTKRRVVCA